LKHLNGHWRPSKRQVELLADCVAAGLDTARTARVLGVDETMFVTWTKRLAAAVAEEERREAEFLEQNLHIQYCRGSC
jgi:hypothetical protein